MDGWWKGDIETRVQWGKCTKNEASDDDNEKAFSWLSPSLSLLVDFIFTSEEFYEKKEG